MCTATESERAEALPDSMSTEFRPLRYLLLNTYYYYYRNQEPFVPHGPHRFLSFSLCSEPVRGSGVDDHRPKGISQTRKMNFCKISGQRFTRNTFNTTIHTLTLNLLYPAPADEDASSKSGQTFLDCTVSSWRLSVLLRD